MDRIGLICRYIKEDPRSTQRDLAQKTGFSVGTVNTLIKEAMQQRLIAQGKSVAGTYELTGAGDAFLEQFSGGRRADHCCGIWVPVCAADL